MRSIQNRVILLLLLSILFVSFVLRYPLVEHERHQTDSYYIHMLADSIIDNEFAIWVFHPLSLVGYYPYSYPSAIPFLVAESSEMTGCSVEVTILLLDMVLAALFCFSVFVLAREFTGRLEVVVVATLLASLGARFVDTTYWDGSARGPLVVFATLLVFVLMRANSQGQRHYLTIALPLLAISFAIHHMAVLILLFGVAYVFTAIHARYLLPRFRNSMRGYATLAYAIIVLMLVVAAGFGAWSYFGELALRNLGATALFSFEPRILSLLGNLAAYYTNQIGFILIPAVVVAPYMLVRRPQSGRVLFLVVILIAFIPVLGNSWYVSMILTPFAAILGSESLFALARSAFSMRTRFVTIVVAIMISSSFALTVWSTARWTGNEYATGDPVMVDAVRFNDGNYLLWQCDDSQAISNSNHAQLQLSAMSDVRFLDSGIYQVLSGDIGPQEVNGNVTLSGEGFPKNLYIWFEYVNESNVNAYVQSFMRWGMIIVSAESQNIQISEYFSSHNRLLVITDNGLGDWYANPYFVQNPILLDEVREARWSYSDENTPIALDSYVLYSSVGSTIYLLGF